jgi:cellulose synthase/poly-beta-1,6-N-acetylglucosamine synthase-like glycosyltransferase
MTAPYVSIIVPAFNAETTLSACLASLVAQEYPKDRYEVLVVDNRSRDRTADIIRSFAVTYLSETERQSSYAARNAGIRRASGEILAFTDADCVADPKWLAKAAPCFQDATVGGVAGKVGNHPPVNAIQEYLFDVLAQDYFISHVVHPYAITANVLYRREVFDRVGLFEGRWRSGGDADLAWRMQTRSSYRLVYCESACVTHQHRRTRAGHFRQRWNWGYGEVLLYARYREDYIRRGLRYSPRAFVDDYRTLLRVIGRWARACLLRGLARINARDYEFAVCDCLSEIGTRVGRIHGSFRERVLYV